MNAAYDLRLQAVFLLNCYSYVKRYSCAGMFEIVYNYYILWEELVGNCKLASLTVAELEKYFDHQQAVQERQER